MDGWVEEEGEREQEGGGDRHRYVSHGLLIKMRGQRSVSDRCVDRDSQTDKSRWVLS